MSLREFGVKAWLWENWKHCWQHSAFLLATWGSRKRQASQGLNDLWFSMHCVLLLWFSMRDTKRVLLVYYLCNSWTVIFNARYQRHQRHGLPECHIFYAVTIPAAQEWTNLASSNSRSSLLTSPYRLQVLCSPISINHIQNSRSSLLTSDLFLSSSNLVLSNV